MVEIIIGIVVFLAVSLVIAVVFGRARSLGGRRDYGVERLQKRNRRTVETWKHTRKIEEDAGATDLEPVPWWVCCSCLWTGKHDAARFTLLKVFDSLGDPPTAYCPDCRGELELY